MDKSAIMKALCPSTKIISCSATTYFTPRAWVALGLCILNNLLACLYGKVYCSLQRHSNASLRAIIAAVPRLIPKQLVRHLMPHQMAVVSGGCQLFQLSMTHTNAVGKTSGNGGRKMTVLLSHFSSRILASSITWFVNDFAFYGNKLFQGTFIKIINPKAGLIEARASQLLTTHAQQIAKNATCPPIFLPSYV